MPLRLVAVVCAVIFQNVCAWAADSAAWRAGVARENITPPAGMWMTGFAARTAPAAGTAQELWAKALAFADPAGNRGVLITADVCGIDRVISDRVAAALHARYQLPRSAVLVNVSHTHCSPALPGYLRGLRLLPPEGVKKAEDYTRELEQKMIRAATRALETLAPATLSWSEDEAHFGFNRRENPIKDVPALRAAGKLRGPFEPRVPVLAVRSTAGELRAVLVSYACHNTTLAFNQWHGDYAGCAQAELEQRHPGAVALFASGCGADMNPAPRGELAHAEQHGRDLADSVDRALAKKMTPLAGRFATAFADITLSFARRPTDEQLQIAREKDQPNREMHQAWSAVVSEDLQARGADALRHTYPIQAWRIGDLSWIALGGEVVIDYSIRLRRELGADVWVFGYSNDVMAYIPSERVLKEGRYEGETSMVPYARPGPWSPGLENKIIEQAHALVAQTRPR